MHEQLLAGHGTAVALENTEGERVYVNPAAIAYFEAAHPDEAPVVEFFGH